MKFIILIALISACGSTSEFSGKSHTKEPEPTTITVCQSIPNQGSYIIQVSDGEVDAVQPINILGVY